MRMAILVGEHQGSILYTEGQRQGLTDWWRQR